MSTENKPTLEDVVKEFAELNIKWADHITRIAETMDSLVESKQKLKALVALASEPTELALNKVVTIKGSNYRVDAIATFDKASMSGRLAAEASDATIQLRKILMTK